MKFLLLITIIWVASAQELVEDIICPVPGLLPSVSQQECSLYTACEYTNDVCHMKKNSEAGYIVAGPAVDTFRGVYIPLQKAVPANTLFGADILDVIFEVVIHEEYHLQIKIYDPTNERYEVPFPLYLPEIPDSNQFYTIETSAIGAPFAFNVTRFSTGQNILRSDGPLSFEDQFIQITYRLPSTYFYGLGENPHKDLRRSFDTRRTAALFSRDTPPSRYDSDANVYGTHPYYVNIEDDIGNTHSVLLYNSNAMEFSTFLLGSEPAVTIRTIGGILDFHVFFGPTPEDVNIQYANTIGKAVFPPYWALGFHLSRYGYNSIDNYRIVYDRMKAAQIPWDTQTFDIDAMENRRDFTYDPYNWTGFPDLILELHNESMKVVLIQDPAIAIDWDNYPTAQRGRDSDIFIKWSNTDDIPPDQPEGAGDYMVGYVWPNNRTVFPDFLNPNTTVWWANELQIYHDTLNFDGIWIDMNEPSNFGTNLRRPLVNYPPELPDWSLKCPNNSVEDPPYGTYATYAVYNLCSRISDQTLCMSGKQTDGTQTFLHYDVHSLYGYSETIATYNAATQTLFPGQRPFIYSRSTFPGSGQYAAHWTGDNVAHWDQLRMSLIGIVEFNMFGIPFIGADVCGFQGDTTEELCIRWMQTGAFYPFDRNHNDHGQADQDPAKPGWDLAPVYSRQVLLLRYKYIPFMYAKLHRAHFYGESVIRPLFNLFTSDLVTRDVQDQFMWSTELMVAPVVHEGAVSRNVYFPEGYWYDLVNGSLVSSTLGTQNVQAPLDQIPVFVRGGSILPFQEPSLTTTDSRANPFGFTVALADDGSAAGEVFWDDGVSEHIDELLGTFLGILTFSQNTLTLASQNNPAVAAGLMLETIQFYGFSFNPSEIDVNGVPAPSTSWSFDASLNVLNFTLSVPLNADLTVAILN